MSQAIASNIRTRREAKSWTQEQLAAAAQVTARTVQRAEAGHGASAETILAIAGALNVDVDLLRFDPIAFWAQRLGVPRDQLTPELIAEKQRDAAKNYTIVPLTEVKSSTDLKAVHNADAMYCDCTCDDERILDLTAELKQALMDLVNIKHEIGALGQREYQRDIFNIVKQIKATQAAVCLSLRQHPFTSPTIGTIPLMTLFVVISPANEIKTCLLIDKSTPTSFL